MNDLIIERIVVGDLETNCYVLADRETMKGFIIDPGGEPEKIKRAVKKLAVIPAGIINTHGHFDHIRGDGDFDIPVYIHQEDVLFLRDPAHNFSSVFPPPYEYAGAIVPLNDGDVLPLGARSIKVIHTPGHTPGSVCLLVDTVLFSGDTLFYHSVGRTDMAYADQELLISSIRRKLLPLPSDTAVFPGHGARTSMKQESAENPFIRG